MSQPPAPKISRAPALPLIWVVPVVALLVGGWMIFREVHNRGPEIVIDFENGSGVEAGKTVLEHKGVSVGVVKDVELKPDLSSVTVKVRLDRDAAALANGGSQFWIVHPEVGFSGIRGLDTLVTGVRLNVQPGTGPRTDKFTGLSRPPAREDADAGPAFLLYSDRLGALTAGAPVYYREVKVGMVETSRLADDAGAVLVRIRIQKPYAPLVRTNTQFWNAGGVSLKVGLFGAEIKNTSLESLVTGAVSFATPDGALAPLAEDGAGFTLSNEFQKEWLTWRPRIAIKPVETAPDPPPAPSANAAVSAVIKK